MDLDDFLQVARKPLYFMIFVQLIACIMAVGVAFDAVMQDEAWFQAIDFILLVVALVVPALVGMAAYRKTHSFKQTIVKGAVFGFFVGLTGLVLALAFQPIITSASQTFTVSGTRIYSPMPFPVHVGWTVYPFDLLVKWVLAIIANAVLAGIGCLGIVYARNKRAPLATAIGVKKKRK
ncbi:MAG: hypothetical protein QW343_02620 [Candidatus Norongarragalinales archaeon]